MHHGLQNCLSESPFDSGLSHVLAAPISFYLRVTLAISKIPITFVLTDPVCEFFD
jgi:hypothetical protein